MTAAPASPVDLIAQAERGTGGIRFAADSQEAFELSSSWNRQARRVRSLDPLQTSAPLVDDYYDRTLPGYEEELFRLRRGQWSRTCVISDAGTMRFPVLVDRFKRSSRVGEQVSRVKRLAVRVMVFDQSHALLGLPDGKEGTLVVTDPAVVARLGGYVDQVHARAAAWDPERLDQDDELRERVVDLLGEGLVDDAIARRLDVSPRTVARVIAALMREHDCQTRFQLGAALAVRSA